MLTVKSISYIKKNTKPVNMTPMSYMVIQGTDDMDMPFEHIYTL